MRRSLLLPALAVALLSACAAGGPAGSASPTSVGATAGDAAAVEALQFSAPLVGGGKLDLAQFAGRPVVLWFWAPT